MVSLNIYNKSLFKAKEIMPENDANICVLKETLNPEKNLMIIKTLTIL